MLLMLKLLKTSGVPYTPCARLKGYANIVLKSGQKVTNVLIKVHIHAVQELFKIFQLTEDSEANPTSIDSTSDQLFLTLSVAAVSGKLAPKTMCMLGVIQGIPVNILVDSGSSHNFFKTHLATKLNGASAIVAPIKVKVANGFVLHCSSHLKQAQ